jgi:CheY-like chemotaxis protein
MSLLVQTAYGLSGDREKAIEAGCNKYIAKPINLTVLNNLIKKLFT